MLSTNLMMELILYSGLQSWMKGELKNGLRVQSCGRELLCWVWLCSHSTPSSRHPPSPQSPTQTSTSDILSGSGGCSFVYLTVLLCFTKCGWPISHFTLPSEAAHLIHSIRAINYPIRPWTSLPHVARWFFRSLHVSITVVSSSQSPFVSFTRAVCFLFILWNSSC